jgi:N-methylhydantoinase A
MTASIREISIQQGHDPRDFTLIAFGGAGPMHAIPIAEELGIPSVLVPRHPGNFSALGLLVSDVKHDDVRTRVGRLPERLPALEAAFDEMGTAAARRLDAEGFDERSRRSERSLDLRYAGQAFELNVPLPPGALDATAIIADFNARHLAAYGHADPHGDVEVVNARMSAFGVVDKPEASRWTGGSGTIEGAQIATRDVWFAGRAVTTPVYERDRLPERARMDGPAIVEEFGATTVVFPRWRANVDGDGNLILERST